MSVFEDQQSAEESNTKAAEWVVQNLSELLRPTPEYASGQVVGTRLRSEIVAGTRRRLGYTLWLLQ